MQSSTPLATALIEMHNKKIVPFDVPGHKQGKSIPELVQLIGKRAIDFDVNSRPDIDSLNSPEGVILEAQQLMAQAFGAKNAYFTVNGTTMAVQAMILSACQPGEKIILPRNIHKSAVNALILSDAIPVYMQPDICGPLQFSAGVSLDTVKSVIDQNLDAKAIFIINPTYYGACSDLASIVEYAHSKNIAVVVDEAHGAHLHFNDRLPLSAMQAGADMSAVSVHKTGGALTQASALMLNDGIISKERVQAVLNIMQTTSASYLLMASLDIARKNLALNGKQILDNIIDITQEARQKINQIDGFYAYGEEVVSTKGFFNIDQTKLGINVAKTGLTGYEVYDILVYDYKIQLELADLVNVLAIVSIGDTKNSLDRLVSALADIAQKNNKKVRAKPFTHTPFQNPKLVVSPRAAFYAKKQFVPIEECEGRVIAESVMVYPPGIPILAPGELITSDIIRYISFLKTQNAKLTDMSDKYLNNFLVLNE